MILATMNETERTPSQAALAYHRCAPWSMLTPHWQELSVADAHDFAELEPILGDRAAALAASPPGRRP